jgi:hypothetical protein
LRARDRYEELRREALEAVEKHGSIRAAAKALGEARTTIQSRIADARADGLEPTPKVELPSFVLEGDEEEPIEDILVRFRKDHERRAKAALLRTWYTIKINETLPYALIWFGDPHLGPHCDWRTLDRDIKIARQDGVYGAQIGDLTDNWPWTGRLARLWAENDISTKTERRLANWFMLETGIRWLCWLIGNHDEWNGTSEIYKLMGAHHIPMHDWRAQFTLEHLNGSKTRIDAAHGRKGSSLYNPTHGTLRDAKFGEHADLFVSGHIHSFGLFDIEFPEKRTASWLAQISGYKTLDHHALVNGYAESRRGSSILSIIDPETGRVQCFADVEFGADYLRYLRAKK